MREDDGIRFRHMLDASWEAVYYGVSLMKGGVVVP